MGWGNTWDSVRSLFVLLDISYFVLNFGVESAREENDSIYIVA